MSNCYNDVMKVYSTAVLSLCFLLSPLPLTARPLLDYSGMEHPSRDTVYTFTFTLSEYGSNLIMDVHSELERGRLNIWLGGGGYEVIGNYTDRGSFQYENIQFGPLNNTEPITVHITARRAQGKWSVRITEHSRSRALTSLLVSGLLITIICALFIAAWKMTCRSSLRWLYFGGIIWLIGVALKFLFAYFLNAPILAAIESLFHKTGYLIIGSLYIGSLTGIFEIGVTLVFALLVRSVYADACRTVGVGIGAGTGEALLIGFSQIGSFVIARSGFSGGEDILNGVVAVSLNTPALALVAPVERLLVILCHIASRTLVLYAVSRRKPVYFWTAFFLLTAIDMIAGYVHLAGLVNTISMWWIELTLIPFALVSILIVRRCVRNWRNTGTDQPAIVKGQE
jgi:uncharacterized membrane protein YhfC